MSTTEKVLDFLERSKGRYVSGSEMAREINVSRNAVWKAIKNLESSGYEISAVTNKGYMLAKNNGIISASSIAKFINNDKIKVEYRDCVTSTNLLLKEMAEQGEEEGKVLVAGEQTQGRGRLGRRFESKKGCGVYFSILLRPQMKPSDSLLITTCAAVAAAKAVEKHTGKPAFIKWVNDIYLRGKKVCGILTQAAFDMEGDKLSYAVLGIGINIFFEENDIPEELKDIAGAVFDEKPDSETVSRLVADVINNFMAEYRVIEGKHYLFDYTSRSYLDSKPVFVITPLEKKEATAVKINDDFSIRVLYDNGKYEDISSGEVSIRPI